MRIRSRVLPFAVVLCAGFSLAACGNDDSSSDTTAVAETTVAGGADTSAVPETTAAADTTVAAETTAVADTVAAADTTASSETTAAGESADTTIASTDDTAAASDSSIPISADAILGIFGITPGSDEAKCINDKVDPTELATLSGDTPPAKVMRTLLTCAGDKMSATVAADLPSKVSGVTKEQAACVVSKSFEVLLKQNDADFTRLLNDSSDTFPAELQDDVVSASKSCGLSDAKLKELLNA